MNSPLYLNSIVIFIFDRAWIYNYVHAQLRQWVNPEISATVDRQELDQLPDRTHDARSI